MYKRSRPRVLILADQYKWAYDFDAQSLKKWLVPRYDITVRYAREKPDLSRERFDLLYVLFYGDEHHRQFGIPKEKIVKQVSSHRWAYEEVRGKLTPEQMVERYLQDCGVVTTSSRRLLDMFAPLRNDVYYCPHGIELDAFKYRGRRSGPLKIGWVGHPGDFLKGLREILIPATEGRFDFRYTDGTWSFRQVRRFYHDIDVLAISSIAEGDPRPLMEGMLCGCFPVSTDVGIVPELVNNRFNGVIVDRTPEAFRAAFEWCEAHLSHIRRVAAYNARMCAAARGAEHVAGRTGDIFDLALGLRSDDVPQDVHPGKPGPSRSLAEAEIEPLPFDDASESAYGRSAASFERSLLPLLPDDRAQAIVDMTGNGAELVRFLLENGYRNVGAVSRSADDVRRLQNGSRLVTVIDERALLDDPTPRFDAVILLDASADGADEALRRKVFAAYSMLRDNGRILLHTHCFDDDKTSVPGKGLLALLSEAGFAESGLHAPTGPVSTLEGIRRVAALLLSRHAMGAAWEGDVVAWGTKSDA